MRESRSWNYVVTAHKPTKVTHSCVGNFTSSHQQNLIIGKCTRIEIHLCTPQGLQLMLDVPIYGRIATLELFRPCGETHDFLLIATEKYKFFVLQWDADTLKLITRKMGDVSECIGRLTDSGPLGIIDPTFRWIGLRLYDGLFTICSLGAIPFDNKGLLQESIHIRLEELHVLDIKFLYGCSKPTIAVLYQDDKDARHVKTYEVAPEERFVEGQWSQNNVDNGAYLLVPVSLPLGGVIIIGEQTIAYRSANAFEACTHKTSFTRAYGRIHADGGYLLSDIVGHLHLLSLTRVKKRVTIKVKLLGETSIASTISCLNNGCVFVGSNYGDSQLIKLNHQPDAKGSYLDVLERFVNLGPIMDLCVVDPERQGQGQVVTCSGAFKDGSLRIVRHNLEIREQASLELLGIKGLWSLRSSFARDAFLVISFSSETRILAMNSDDELEETEIEGFDSQVRTLFCCEAVHNQFVQVTATSIRLVNSRSRCLCHEWKAGYPITIATANDTQVLLATGSGHLVYLEIGDGILTLIKYAWLKYEVSCLDIYPICENFNHSQMAAVGMWTDVSVQILSLPNLEVMAKEHLGGEIIPRSVLFCVFEGVSYLLCALGDGHLFNFILNTGTGRLSDGKKVSLGTQPVTLHTFSSKGSTHVFATSDRPTVIYSSNQKLLFANVSLKEVSHVCSVNIPALPDSLAIAKEGKLIIGTIDDIHKRHIQTIPLGEHPHRISHQEKSHTFAICTSKYCPSSMTEMHFVRLLDDQTFEVISSYPFDEYEYGCSISSCSFSGDNNTYYCVGTSNVLPEESEPFKGRILVFMVQDRKLKLIAEKETKGAVYSLNAFNGKLLASINQKIRLYKWMLQDDCSPELLLECGHHGNILALYVQTRGDLIVVGDLVNSMSLLIYKHGQCAIEECACDFNAKRMTAVEILDDDVYLGAENNFNIFTVRKISEVATDAEQGHLEVVGEYHLGEFVNRFQHGSLVKRPLDFDVGQIPTVIFGTVNGMIGVIASLPHEQYILLEKLQSNLQIEGVGGLSHAQWRSPSRGKGATNFLDGDLIESFLDLSQSRMAEISKVMGVAVDDLCQRVGKLTMMH